MLTGPDKFARILADYHKTKSERAAQCIADVVDLLCSTTDTAQETSDKIADRIIQYYERKD